VCAPVASETLLVGAKWDAEITAIEWLGTIWCIAQIALMC
jgi:hypothetical protein